MQILEPAIPGAVTRDVCRFLAADRLCRRAPQLAAVVIPDVDRLADRVADRVVGPWRELVLAAVPRPGVARPGLGDLETKRRIRDHVQPGRRSGLPRTQDRHVLAPVLGKATEPVGELQLRTWRGRLGLGLPRHRRFCRHRDPVGGALQADDLVGQAAPAAQQDGAGGRLEERAVLVGDMVAAQDVDAAVPRMALEDQAGLAHPHEGLERLLEWLGVAGAVFVEDHEIDVEQLEPPVLVGTEELPDDVEVFDFVDPNHHDREVTGDTVGPKPRSSSLVARQQAGRGAK